MTAGDVSSNPLEPMNQRGLTGLTLLEFSVVQDQAGVLPTTRSQQPKHARGTETHPQVAHEAFFSF